MRPIQGLLLATALLAPSIANAAPDKAAPMPSEIRLSDEEKEKVLEAAAANSRDQGHSHAVEGGDEAPRQIHGEVGFTVGTGGYRSAYGTAVVPLEGNGVAIISLGSTDLGSRARYLIPWWH